MNFELVNHSHSQIEVDSRDPLDQPTLLAYATPEQQAPAAAMTAGSGSPNGSTTAAAAAIPQFDRPPRPGGGPRRITKVVQ
jgi:hypothetical protein